MSASGRFPQQPTHLMRADLKVVEFMKTCMSFFDLVGGLVGAKMRSVLPGFVPFNAYFKGAETECFL